MSRTPTDPASTRIPEVLHRAVADAHLDVGELSRTARRRGLAIRRRRQALSAVGVASLVAVTLGGIHLAAPYVSAPPGVPRVATAPSVTPTPLPAVPQETRFSGRATAAALRDAVATLGAGVSDHFAGQDPVSRPGEVYAELRWHPTDGTGLSVVEVNVQPAFGPREIYHCAAWQVRCSVTHPSRGQTLMTYEERNDTVDGTGIRVVADLLRRDGVRVVASASNGLDLPANHWKVTRPRPPFRAHDLVGVVSRPEFAPRMPGRLQDEGDRLAGYENLSTSLSGPSPTAAP